MRFAKRMSRVIGIVSRALAAVAVLSAGATLAGAQSRTLPVYRFFNNNAGGHFFTISEAERDAVIENYPWFRYEGVGFYAYPTQVAGTSPVYRFFNNNAGGHFFTISESEKNAVIDNYNWFRFENVGFYTHPSQISGTFPVYRFFNNNAGGHFFTISESEMATVIVNYDWFRYEAIGFYAYPSPASPGYYPPPPSPGGITPPQGGVPNFTGYVQPSLAVNNAGVTKLTPPSPPPLQANCLFNWAEGTYPMLFAPAGAASMASSPWYYRYYWQTDAYVGTSSADDHVYYMGPASDYSIFDAGPMSSWLPAAGCP